MSWNCADFLSVFIKMTDETIRPGRCYRNDFLNITYSSKDQGSGSSSLGDVRVSVFCEKLSVFKQPWLFELYRMWQRFQSIFCKNIAGVLFTQKTT